jgi:hypothetical protein
MFLSNAPSKLPSQHPVFVLGEDSHMISLERCDSFFIFRCDIFTYFDIHLFGVVYDIKVFESRDDSS